MHLRKAIAEVGAETVWQGEPLFNPALLLPFGFGLSLFGKNRMAYYGIVSILGLLSFQACRFLVGKWQITYAFHPMNIAERAGEFMVIAGLLYLFYQVTFSRPSRSYYGLVKASAL